MSEKSRHDDASDRANDVTADELDKVLDLFRSAPLCDSLDEDEDEDDEDEEDDEDLLGLNQPLRFAAPLQNLARRELARRRAERERRGA